MSVGFEKTGIVRADGHPNRNLAYETLRLYNPTAYNAYQIMMDQSYGNLVVGKTYTIQFWDVDVSHSAKTASTLGISIYWGGGSVGLANMIGTSYFTNGHADHLSATITITQAQASGSGASNAWLNIYNSPGYVAGTMNMSIGKWKVEEGSIPTAWNFCNDAQEYNSWKLYVGNSGFIEYNDNCKVQKNGYIQANEFIEF